MICASIGTVALIAVSIWAPTSPMLLTGCMLFYAFGSSWMMAVYFAEGMEILPDIKGVTASLLTSGRLLLTAVIVGVVSHLYDGTVYPLVISIVFIMVVSLITMHFYEKKKQLQNN